MVCSLSDFRSDADVGDGRPRVEKIIEKFHKISLADFVLLSTPSLFLLGNHFERDASFVSIASTFQNLHVLDKVLEVDLNFT